MIRVVSAISLACAAALGLAACASGSAAPSALQFADEGTVYCEQIHTGVDGAIGIPLDHDGETIVLQSVRAVDEDGIKVVDSTVMLVDPHDRIGTDYWPITDAPKGAWEKRKPIKDTKIESDSHADLILRIHPVSKAGGSISNVEITYKQGGEERSVSAHRAIEMKTTC